MSVAVEMADSYGYPRYSNKSYFNYGSTVATASIRIRMETTQKILTYYSLYFIVFETIISCIFDFLRKVYSILSVQVLLTTVTAALFLYFESVKTFVHGSPFLLLFSAIGSLGTVIALTIHRHQHPMNLYLLFGFTLLEAITVAIAVTFYEVAVVVQAFILTTAVFLGLTAFTFQSKRDFSKLGAGLFAGLCILILAGFLRLSFYSNTIGLAIAAVGALLFCGLIIYDTHILMHQLSPDEHILASINLYLDIINLFLHLLRLQSKK